MFKQQFFVETRAGAGGTIGVKSVIDSPPDGYNFVLTNISHLVLLPIGNPKLGYDPLKDLITVGYIAGSPIVLSVNSASNVKTIKEFIGWAQRSPKPLTYSSSGLGSSGHLVAETFAQMTGIKIEHVPYKGASQGLTDLAGNHIAFSAQTVSSTGGAGARRHPRRAGAFERRIALRIFLTCRRSRKLGYDIVATTWFTISGPAGLPKDIVQKVNHEMIRAMTKPEMQQRLRQDGLIAHIMSVEELSKYIDAETARWRPVLDQLGLIGK